MIRCSFVLLRESRLDADVQATNSPSECAVGLDTPGPASADGVISSRGATNFALPDWYGFDVRSALERRLGLPVVYNNDGNVAALYAHVVHFGARYPDHELAGLPIDRAARLVRSLGERGDRLARRIFEQQAMALGRLFTIAANFTDPGAYFGGGVVETTPDFRDWFLGAVREHTRLREEQARVAIFALVPDLDMAGARGRLGRRFNSDLKYRTASSGPATPQGGDRMLTPARLRKFGCATDSFVGALTVRRRSSAACHLGATALACGGLLATDFFTMETVGLTLLNLLLVVEVQRKLRAPVGISAHPTGACVAQQTGTCLGYVVADAMPLPWEPVGWTTIRIADLVKDRAPRNEMPPIRTCRVRGYRWILLQTPEPQTYWCWWAAFLAFPRA